MKKRIIKLTESDLRNIIKRVISEQFDMDYYDIILDLYNEVGLEGMTDDEIKYLKSGGESNVPDRFLGGDVDIDSVGGEEDISGIDKLKEIMDRYNHKIVDTAPDGKLRVVFKDRDEILKLLESIDVWVEVKQGYAIVIIPKNWTDDIFGEEI